MIQNKFTRWNPKIHSPADRCISSSIHGPCPYIKNANSEYCPRHGSNSIQITHNESVQRNFRLRRWQQRVNELADNDQLKSLREECGILRMMLEEMLNKCEDSTDLLLYSHRISDLVLKIERLVVSCDKLENRMGLLLSKDAVLQLAGTYVNIINNYVQDADIIEQISDEIIKSTQLIESIDAV